MPHTILVASVGFTVQLCLDPREWDLRAYRTPNGTFVLDLGWIALGFNCLANAVRVKP